MLKSSVIARNYAKALFSAAKKENAVDKVAAELEVFKNHFSEDFANELQNPVISKNDLVKIMEEITQKFSFDQIVSGFFLTLADNKRLNLFLEVYKEFSVLLKKQKNILEAEITFAVEPDAAQLNQIKSLIEKKHSDKVIEVKKTINPQILGGFQVRIGSDVIDASLKNQLLNLSKEFASAIN